MYVVTGGSLDHTVKFMGFGKTRVITVGIKNENKN
jgi:hypothetical protein